MSKVQHIVAENIDMFVGSVAVATTRNEKYVGPTAVTEHGTDSGLVANWGSNNLFPQEVADDKKKASIISAVIERKVNMAMSGGLTYGTVGIDDKTGFELMKPMRDSTIEKWMRDANIMLFLREAWRDWYTYYNVFVEFTMGRGSKSQTVLGMGVQDACHVRLGVQNTKGEITKAYVADWRNTNDVGSAIKFEALDPYFRVVDQIKERGAGRYILPIRDLGDDQFYYGLAPWNGLRANGWIDVALRVPVLKKHLLTNLMHLRYHIEYAPAFWPAKYPGWENKTTEQKDALKKEEVTRMNTWLKGDKTQGGVYVSGMSEQLISKEMQSMVKINELKMGIAEGAYIEDSQEAEFIICRDLGLAPSLHGISPSKSGSSPGSGSEARTLRTQHILDAKPDMDFLLQPLHYVAELNGWPEGIQFWFRNYYVATKDRINQVEDKPNAGPEA